MFNTFVASFRVILWSIISIALVSMVLALIPAGFLWYILPIVLPFINSNYVSIWVLVSSFIMILRSAK